MKSQTDNRYSNEKPSIFDTRYASNRSEEEKKFEKRAQIRSDSSLFKNFSNTSYR